MKISSPINNIIQVLSEVVETANQHEAKLSKNEAATRAALIDPVLHALGWNTTSPDMVEFEKTYGNTRLDYALYDSSGKVQAIVEAKCLGANLNDTKTVSTLMSYAFTHAVPSVFLTDGLIWQHFFQATPGNVFPYTFDLVQRSKVECAHYLVDHLDAALYWHEDPAPTSAMESTSLPEIAGLKSQVARLQAQIDALSAQKSAVSISVPDLARAGTQPILFNATSGKSFTELKDLPQNLTGQKPPIAFRLPDGRILNIKSWRLVLEESCKFVLANQHNIHIPLMDKSGKTVKLLSWTPPDHNVAHISLPYQGKQVYIFLNYSANNCIANALHILNLLQPEKIKAPPAVSFE